MSENAWRREYHRTCRRKIRYKKLKTARRVIKKLKAKGNDKKDPEDLRVYRCPFCRGFHVGHTQKPPLDNGPGPAL